MKKNCMLRNRWPLVFGAVYAAMNLTSQAHAQSLYYDPGLAGTSPWFGNSWSASSSGPYTSAWTDGNTAVFNSSSTQTIQVAGSNVQLSGLSSLGASVLTLTGTSAGRRTLTFQTGSEVSSQSLSNSVDFGNYLDVSGNFTLTGGGVNFATGPNGATYNGTAAIQAGARIQLSGGLGASWSNANFVVDGVFRTGGGAAMTFGGVTVNAGTMEIGAQGTGNTSVTVSSLSGAGGLVQARAGTGTSTHALNVAQAGSTTFSGTLQGVTGAGANARYLALTKSNTGTLTLNGGVINLQQGTTVSGGTLLINGAGTRTFDNLAGTNAITVGNGGAFGGNSTLTIAGGENVVVQEGGSLLAGGGIGNIGTTGLNFGAGGNLNLSGVFVAEGWLHFDLGADTLAGTTFDQIVLTGGNLALGAGILEFDDFTFNTLAGFGEGTYTLFVAGSHSGSLGSELSGAIGDDFTGTISLSGNNVVLSVVAVPEPQSAVMVFAGCMVTIGLLRRRRVTGRS